MQWETGWCARFRAGLFETLFVVLLMLRMCSTTAESLSFGVEGFELEMLPRSALALASAHPNWDEPSRGLQEHVLEAPASVSGTKNYLSVP
jgi:hypothetical protein